MALLLVVSTATAALLAVAAYAGAGVAALSVAVVVVGLAAGWPWLLRLPSPRGSMLVVAASGLAAAAACSLAGVRDEPAQTVVVIVALSVLGAFVHELMRRDGRPRLVESVTGTFAGQVVAILASGWALVPLTPMGPDAVVVAAAGVVVGRLCLLLPLPAVVAGWAGVLLAGVAGAATAAFAVDMVTPVTGAGIGMLVGAIAVALDQLLTGPGRENGPTAVLAVALAPIAAAGTAVYAVAVLVGS